MRNLWLLLGLVVGLVGVSLGTAPAGATVIVTASETGGDVVFSGSGTLDLTALSFFITTDPKGVNPSLFFVLGLGPFADVYDSPLNFSGPSSIGPGVPSKPAFRSGDMFGISFVGGLIVPIGYTSGSPLSGSSTYTGETFASIGLTPGTYVWSWGSGSSADSLTLNIPEPSAVLFLATGLAGLAWRNRRR